MSPCCATGRKLPPQARASGGRSRGGSSHQRQDQCCAPGRSTRRPPSVVGSILSRPRPFTSIRWVGVSISSFIPSRIFVPPAMYFASGFGSRSFCGCLNRIYALVGEGFHTLSSLKLPRWHRLCLNRRRSGEILPLMRSLNSPGVDWACPIRSPVTLTREYSTRFLAGPRPLNRSVQACNSHIGNHRV